MKKALPLSLLALSAALALVSFLLLPETVVTQLSIGGNPTTMPKILAVALPFLLGAGGSVGALAAKGNGQSAKKCLIISAVGILVFVIMLIVNLAA